MELTVLDCLFLVGAGMIIGALVMNIFTPHIKRDPKTGRFTK